MADPPTEKPPGLKVDIQFSSPEAAARAFGVIAKQQGILFNPLTQACEPVKVFIDGKEMTLEQLAALAPVSASPPPETKALEPSELLSALTYGGGEGLTLGKTIGQILDEDYANDREFYDGDDDAKGNPLL